MKNQFRSETFKWYFPHRDCRSYCERTTSARKESFHNGVSAFYRCTNCGKGTYKKKKSPYNFLGEEIGVFDALVCTHCQETLFESAVSDQIEAEVKRRGLWGLRARTNVAKVGNALDVRIPKSLAEFLSLKQGQEVILEPLDKNRLQVIVE
ncbi:hypothetical protein HYX14_01220 [Candidatus Woesearchaeota archaeon]|nr:hypothetical protein [Candidatus Woesearchaeota archaeon]